MTTENSDILLDTVTHDLKLIGYDVVLSDKSQATAQRIKVRLKSFLGEWFLDQLFGIPYYQNILIKAPDLNLIRALIRKQIITVPHITELVSFDVDLNTSNRSLTVNFIVKCDDEDIIEGTLTLP